MTDYQKKLSTALVNTTGIFGVLSFIMTQVSIVLYFMYSGEPPIWNVLLRSLITAIYLIFILVFFAGFKHIIKRNNDNYHWLTTLLFSAASVFITTNLIAHSLEAGAVFNPAGVAVDATQDGLLAQANYLLYGSFGRIITAAFMFPVGIITFRTKLLPLWTGWMAYIIAVINVAFIPSAFFGTNAGDFYSAVGWGNSALAASLFTYWILAISILLLKNRKKYTAF